MNGVIFALFSPNNDVLCASTDTKRKAIPISAQNGDGLKELLLSIEAAVLSATDQKLCAINIPTDGPHLRCASITIIMQTF